jgi:hypothetical protein
MSCQALDVYQLLAHSRENQCAKLMNYITVSTALPRGNCCSAYFGDGGLANYLPRLASNHDPPDLSLLSS